MDEPQNTEEELEELPVTELLLRLTRHDERALRALLLRRHRWADAVLGRITHLGGATVTVITALSLMLVPSVPPALARAGTIAGVALGASFTLVQLVKRFVSRPRPQMPPGLETLVRAPDQFSFPSGHSAASLSVALPVALAIGGLWGWAILALALTIGFSRAYLGVHYPGDVVAGWLLALIGIGAGFLVGI